MFAGHCSHGSNVFWASLDRAHGHDEFHCPPPRRENVSCLVKVGIVMKPPGVTQSCNELSAVRSSPTAGHSVLSNTCFQILVRKQSCRHAPPAKNIWRAECLAVSAIEPGRPAFSVIRGESTADQREANVKC
jgi:hypothetical protein